MRTETLKVIDMQSGNTDNTVNQATVSLDDTVISKQRPKATAEDLGSSTARPIHGEDGECCGGCGG